MEKEKNKNIVVLLLVVLVIVLAGLCLLFATGTIKLSSKEEDNSNQNENKNTNINTVCTAEVYDKLEILSMENKTEKIGAIGGSTKGYNVTTTVTKEHSYTSTPENDELYTIDYLGTLFVLYKNKLYYTNKEEVSLKYCNKNTSDVNTSVKLTCDYSKFNDDTIKEFDEINIEANLKALGSYGNAGSGSLRPYAITTDGKVINITGDSSNNYNECGMMYDNSEYPIDRIFNMYFYDGAEYTILLKDGTLITRDVDREHPIELEH